MTLKVEMCKKDITPPITILMDGYGNRKAGAIGIHDKLYANSSRCC